MDSKRQLQVGELIKRNFSTILQLEGNYIYGSALVSVTNVKVTPDLALAKIYVSIYGTDDKNKILQDLKNANFTLRQNLAHRIRNHVRRIPEISIYIDETLDEMYRVEELFRKIKPNHSDEE